MFETLESMLLAAADMVKPPKRLTVPEAAHEYRKLNTPGSYVGPWLNSKTPYLVEPMEVLTSINYEGMIFAGPARTGKSDMFFNWLTHTAICDPADMMIIHMTQAVARDWSITDLRRVFRYSTEVGDRVMPSKQALNVHDVQFLSGMRLLIKWPTISELSGKTIPRGWAADYDRMDQDVEGEGNPYDLLAKRGQTFGRNKMFVAESSPGFEVTDPKWMPSSPHEAPPTKGILSLYNRGDRRQWYWRCLNPSCRKSFVPDFELLNYPSTNDIMEAAEMATMRCPHCTFDMLPEHKDELNSSARWLKAGQLWLPDGSVVGQGLRSKIASFWLFGPAAAFQDWAGLVNNYLTAKRAYEQTGDTGPLKKTINTDQGKAFVPPALRDGRLPEWLEERKQDWGGTQEDPVVPEGVRFLVATVDVQAGSRSSFVVQVHGFGLGSDTWFVAMYKIRLSERADKDGAPAALDPAGYPEDWHVLVDQVIKRTYPLADGSGRRMAVKLVGCDMGGKAGVAANAYTFWRYLRDEQGEGLQTRFQLVRGEPSKHAPRFRMTYPDSERRDRNAGNRGDVPVAALQSNMLKDQIDSMLNRQEPGGGMVSFPVWSEKWLYMQLTAEIRLPEGWKNTRARHNEAWDLFYYAVGLLQHPSIGYDYIDWNKPPSWADIWEKNTLVFGEKEQSPFERRRDTAYDLGALAKALA